MQRDRYEVRQEDTGMWIVWDTKWDLHQNKRRFWTESEARLLAARLNGR